jgi:hypothetical protein
MTRGGVHELYLRETRQFQVQNYLHHCRKHPFDSQRPDNLLKIVSFLAAQSTKQSLSMP